MINLKLHLSSLYKKGVALPIKFPGRILRAQKGNLFSRLFRPIFEKESIKKVLGTNLALLALASTFIPPLTTIEAEYEEGVIESPFVLTTEKGVQNPVESVKITQRYRFYHPGIDYDGLTGDKIYPIMAGVVKETGYSRFGYGNSVLIDHGNGIASFYAHLSKIDVSEGQDVTKQTKLGEMGATGRSFGDHLHLEIYENGRAVNPTLILGN